MGKGGEGVTYLRIRRRASRSRGIAASWHGVSVGVSFLLLGSDCVVYDSVRRKELAEENGRGWWKFGEGRRTWSH